MIARISEELHNAVHDKIILDLTIHYLNNKLEKASNEGKVGFAKHLNEVFYKVSQERKNNNLFLKDNGVTVFEPIPDEDNLFIQYNYSVKVNGGFKEGYRRYWRAAIKNHIRDKVRPYFNANEELQ